MEIEQNWSKWKESLASAVHQGQQMGLSQEDIVKRAENIGDFLARNIDPANPQQQVLQELWSAADQQEQQTMAGVIMKMVQRQPH